MSRINIQGTIDNIKSKTNVYTPVVESVVNSIQSIILKECNTGKIEIILKRENVLDLEDNQTPFIRSITIKDNGIGFNQKNRDSFDTFYSEYKKEIGGKGFGRFMFVKYFSNVRIESVFLDDNDEELKKRSFRFGRKYEIIVDEKIEPTEAINTYSIIHLNDLKNTHSFDKNIETISRKLLEKLLIYFINDSFNCPTIIVKEEDGSNQVVLNDYLTEGQYIKEIADFPFSLRRENINESFQAKVFKIFYPGNQKSKISLTGHNREVTDVNLHKYIPEFEDDFYDQGEKPEVKKNYILKTYVSGQYLDENVSLERETFEFGNDKGDTFYTFSQSEIEQSAAIKTKDLFTEDISTRAEKKISRIKNYVTENAPWHSSYVNDLDFAKIGYNLTDNEIETALHNVKHQKEVETRAKFNEIFEHPEEYEDSSFSEMVSEISDIGKSDLAHYVYNRKCVLEAFKELLKRNEDGNGSLEEEIHNIIYPMRRNSENTSYEDHNLWLLDERLVFSEFISSDEKISSKKEEDALDEPDLVVFDTKRAFRNGDNEFSNPLTIFEFKRPKRKNYREKDDPILQIGRYLEKIRNGKYEMPEGLDEIKVNDCTPIYGYVIADLTPKIREFARANQLTESPDKEGYFGYHTGYRMYVEIVSFKKLLKDATLRNRIFFKKLQIE